jgi:uncharacterized protein
MRFIWDKEKAQQNEKKHKVTFDEAATVWTDPLALIADDPEHSLNEHRQMIIGESFRYRLLVVAYTERGETIRIISARSATKRERNFYAQEN